MCEYKCGDCCGGICAKGCSKHADKLNSKFVLTIGETEIKANKANIKNATSRGVIKLREVKKYITEYEERSSDVFSNEEVMEFVTKLNQYADVISDVKRQHINDVRSIPCI